MEFGSKVQPCLQNRFKAAQVYKDYFQGIFSFVSYDISTYH